MSYRESDKSRKYLEKLKSKGDRALVPYTYTPPMQRVMDIVTILLLIAAIPTGSKSWI